MFNELLVILLSNMLPKYAIGTILSCIDDATLLLLVVICDTGLPTAYIC